MREIVKLIGLAVLLFPLSSYALKSDKDQPANIDASNIDMDFKTGQRIYTGNVIITQGSIRLEADKVVVEMKDGVLNTATAYGKPAEFRQRPDGKPEDVIGHSNKMVLDHPKNTVHMFGSASLTQGRDTTRGKEIHYNMNTDKLKIMGGTSSTRQGTSSATTPKKKTSTTAAPQTATTEGDSTNGRARMTFPVKHAEPEPAAPTPPEAEGNAVQ